MNIYLIFILIMLIGSFLLKVTVDWLDIRAATPELPKEFIGFYDAEKYKRSQEYLVENTRFTVVMEAASLIVTVVFILIKGFNAVDLFARHFGFGAIFTGLIFAAVIILLSEIVRLPFSIYHTFVIEQKYGFNTTTVKTFIFDLLKACLLGVLIGGPVFALVLWFFGHFGSIAWVYCWIAVVVIELFLLFISPVLIMPLFNKFIPLEEGELKRSIEEYAEKENFKMKGLYTMDGSKRSTKSNAFFTGFGKFRRIVLFDTLIARHTIQELVAVLAHEMGHYKLKHIFKNILISVLTAGLMLFIFSFFMNNSGLFKAFGMRYVSVYASVFFFGFLFAPINLFLSIAGNVLSRKYEYEADAYSVRTYRHPEDMIAALKKLSTDNLSNLTPHPLKVFLEYSHPPVLERIQAIRKIGLSSAV